MKQNYDILIRNGTIYNGIGEPPIQADVAINNDHVAAFCSCPYSGQED